MFLIYYICDLQPVLTAPGGCHCLLQVQKEVPVEKVVEKVVEVRWRCCLWRGKAAAHMSYKC